MGRRLYVGNLPYTTGEAELQELFSKAGNVESVRVMRDAATGRARGFAFVEMSTDELPPGDVLIRVEYSGINYKDGLASTENGKVARSSPLVPGVDLAGVVVESSSPMVSIGEAVLVSASGLVTSLAPMTKATSAWAKEELMSSSSWTSS